MTIRPRPLTAGLAIAVLAAIALYFSPQHGLDRPREHYFDWLTQTAGQVRTDGVLVVDIDAASHRSAPEGRWGRAQTADLVALLANAKPAAIAFDLVFSGACEEGNPANIALAQALRAAPSVLGFLASATGVSLPAPRPPLALGKPVAIPGDWFIEGTEHACPLFEAASRSAAASFLVGDADAAVRAVQAIAIAGNDAYPALAIEAVRVARQIGLPVLRGEPPVLQLGAERLALGNAGHVRFVAGTANDIARRTVSAADVVAGTIAQDRIADRIVIVGSSLPNLGGLRASASMPLEPSVQIHADLVTAILTGSVPVRDSRAIPVEAALALGFGILIAFLTTRLRPAFAAVAGICLIIAVLAAPVVVFSTTSRLVDGLSVALALGVVLALTGLAQFTHIRRAESTARQRFSQYLPGSVVARYIDNPDMARFAGEERDVTALFTDIEGFSTLARRVGAHDLVAMLDTYFSEVTQLISAEGGMVDKIVGDAVHALFNAPEDLEDHVDKAITCAIKIRALTEQMRTRPPFADHDFGRTRIGIETGPAVLGEVGHGGKLDYTAHGEAVNLAARLQEANKFLGTDICIGPQAAGQTRMRLVSLGTHDIRSAGMMELFSTEPPKTPA